MARQRLAYTTELTAEEWQLLKPLLPPAKAGGRPRKYALRDVLHGIQDGLRGGWAWRLMPHDLPQGQTADQTLHAWRRDGPGRRIHDPLRDAVRPRMGRHPHPAAASIDAQAVKTPETGGATAMTGPSNSTAARAISALTRRVSCCVSSSMPPT